MAIGRRLSAAALVCCLFAFSAYAQEPSPAPAPANLAFVDGAVDVVQDGVTERADPPLMLIDGDIVRTRNGRAEIVFGDGTLLHLSHDSELEILGDDHLRLTTGRAIVRLSYAAARPYVVDTPAASVRLDAEGEYGITTDRSAQLEVAVTRGMATLTGVPSGTVQSGQRISLAAAGARPRIESFNTARWDAFAQWAADRTHGVATAASAAQLPYQLRPYAPVLDQYGRWDYLAPHGYVWVPSVGAGWRPYYDGAWSFTRYGWTWRGQERWAWPTHHYGRWGFNGAVWFWVPATVWAPAWVSWSVAPGYVSWAPYGWHGGGSGAWRRSDHPAYAPNYSPWRGWTVVRRDHFAPRRHVRPDAIDGDRLDDITRRTLISEAAAVSRREPRAVTRESAVTVPGSRGSVRRPTAVTPADVPAPRAGDHPAYAPPRSRAGERVGEGAGESAGEARRGAVRDPRALAPRPVEAAPRRESPPESAQRAPRGTPRETPGTERPSSPGATEGAGAVQRPQRPGATESGASRAERPPSPRATEGGGAVRRGDAAQPPSRGAPAPAAQTPPPAAPQPSTEGAVRRRPGASDLEPEA
jgi:hypothetical protein